MKRILSLALLSLVLGGCVLVPAGRYDGDGYRGQGYYRGDSYRDEGHYWRAMGTATDMADITAETATTAATMAIPIATEELDYDYPRPNRPRRAHAPASPRRLSPLHHPRDGVTL